MKKKIFVILLSLVIGAGSLFPAQAWAESCGDAKFFGLNPWYATLECERTTDTTGKSRLTVVESNFKEDQLPTTILNVALTVLGDLFFLAGTLAVVLVIVAGIKFILSAGDPANAAKAKKALTSALVGLVIVLLANAIVNTVLHLVA